MATLMDGVKGMLTDAVISKASSLIGLESSSMTSAIGKFLPAIIGGLIGKAGTEKGAGSLLDIFKSKGLKDMNTNDLLGVLGDSKKSNSMLDLGGDLLGSIFGNNTSSILDKLLGMTGLKKAGGSMLLKFLAPIVLRKLAGMVFKNGWGAKKTASYLNDQKSSISSLIPGMSGLLGFAGNTGSTATKTTSSTSYSSGGSSSGSSGGGGSWWKWLLPLLLLGLVGWLISQYGCGDKNDTTSTTTTTTTTGTAANTATTKTTDSHAGHDHAGHDHASHSTTTTVPAGKVNLTGATFNNNGDLVDSAGKVLVAGTDYILDASGNLVDKTGKVLVDAANIPSSLLDRIKAFLGKYSSTKLSVDEAGNLVDASGKVIYKAGDFTQKDGFYYDKAGNKLGRIWGKIVKAIKDAANAVGDAATATIAGMKSLFSDLVTKKEGAKQQYALTNIQWKDNGSRITGFSKAEVEGLAAALKANANGKIVVNGFADDKKLAKDRANVVHDMLVTLGVKKSQISFEGNQGSDKIEISAR